MKGLVVVESLIILEGLKLFKIQDFLYNSIFNNVDKDIIITIGGLEL